MQGADRPAWDAVGKSVAFTDGAHSFFN